MIDLIKNFFDKYLQLDPQTNELLKPINNKKLLIRITDINKNILFSVVDNKLIISNDNISDNILSGSSKYLLELVLNKNLQELIMDKKLQYDGSLNTIKQFYSFFNAIKPDIHFYLSQKIGSISSGILEKPISKVIEFIKTSRKESIKDLREYITEESNLSVSKNEINYFYNQIYKLQQDIDRIQAKFNLFKDSL